MPVDNPLQRYLINSRMLDALVRDADGGLTLRIQHQQPERAAQAANWLPAPSGRFNCVLRLYLPRQELLHGDWSQPPMIPTPQEANP